MNQTTTHAIVLRRVDYGEADRIVTVLSENLGKVAVLAKGVRKLKSKMAGGLELLAVNELTLAKGKTDLYSLRSARMKQSFPNILRDYDCNQQAFMALKQATNLLEDGEGEQYYGLLETYLAALDKGLSLKLLELWWSLRLLSMLGHEPNLTTDVNGARLSAEKTYVFDANSGAFAEMPNNGTNSSETIKLWRLSLQLSPLGLARIKNANSLAESSLEELRLFVANHI